MTNYDDVGWMSNKPVTVLDWILGAAAFTALAVLIGIVAFLFL
jgi:hypothetical protein